MKIAAVVKVGGSLVEGPALGPLCEALGRLAKQHRLLVMAGGGPLADVVRDLDRRYALSPSTAHWMAILAMDQLGLLLADRIEGAFSAHSRTEVERALDASVLPILLPSQWLLADDPLPHSWEVTSDSIAAWVARSVHCPRVVLLKSVDRLAIGGVMVEDVAIADVAACSEVDPYLGHVLAEGADPGFTCWFVSGLYPERLQMLLETGQTIGTRIAR